MIKNFKDVIQAGWEQVADVPARADKQDRAGMNIRARLAAHGTIRALATVAVEIAQVLGLMLTTLFAILVVFGILLWASIATDVSFGQLQLAEINPQELSPFLLSLLISPPIAATVAVVARIAQVVGQTKKDKE